MLRGAVPQQKSIFLSLQPRAQCISRADLAMFFSYANGSSLVRMVGRYSATVG